MVILVVCGRVFFCTTTPMFAKKVNVNIVLCQRCVWFVIQHCVVPKGEKRELPPNNIQTHLITFFRRCVVPNVCVPKGEKRREREGRRGEKVETRNTQRHGSFTKRWGDFLVYNSASKILLHLAHCYANPRFLLLSFLLFSPLLLSL